MMEVKGEALIAIPIFILKKFGREHYERWLKSLSPQAQKVYSTPINKFEWFPLKEIVSEPTEKICELFFNNSKSGAWDCGRYSAEYGLKGFYKVLVKLSTPNILIKRASSIIRSYYRPCTLEVVENTKKCVVLRITEFSDIDTIIEYRIAGWMERAVEICGCRHVSVKITSSLTQDHPYTEYRVSWRN